jgi:hypothetical protein
MRKKAPKKTLTLVEKLKKSQQQFAAATPAARRSLIDQTSAPVGATVSQASLTQRSLF